MQQRDEVARVLDDEVGAELERAGARLRRPELAAGDDERPRVERPQAAEELDHAVEHAGRRGGERHQVGLLAREFDALDLDPRAIHRDRAVPPDSIAGFLALRAPRAGELASRLRARGVYSDTRADILRLGPAPYLRDEQLRAAIGLLGEIVRAG